MNAKNEWATTAEDSNLFTNAALLGMNKLLEIKTAAQRLLTRTQRSKEYMCPFRSHLQAVRADLHCVDCCAGRPRMDATAMRVWVAALHCKHVHDFMF